MLHRVASELYKPVSLRDVVIFHVTQNHQPISNGKQFLTHQRKARLKSSQLLMVFECFHVQSLINYTVVIISIFIDVEGKQMKPKGLN